MLTPNKGRDHNYQTMVISFLDNLMMSAFILACFPEVLKPCAAVSRASIFLRLIRTIYVE
jgi:hypothetical protein